MSFGCTAMEAGHEVHDAEQGAWLDRGLQTRAAAPYKGRGQDLEQGVFEKADEALVRAVGVVQLQQGKRLLALIHLQLP